MFGIPAAPFWLGWAGVLPFAGLAAAVMVGVPVLVDPVPVLIGYGCAILSFMGGAQWGLSTADPAARGSRYAASVLPALVAWPALFLPAATSLATLAAAFAALCVYDLWTVRQGRAPRWYGRLRAQLTAAVVFLLLVAFVAVSRSG